MNKFFFYACYLLDNRRGKIRVKAEFSYPHKNSLMAVNSLEMAGSFKFIPKEQKNNEKSPLVG
ncbi:MAG: hypothetical protein ACI9OH_001415 [Oleispira sp.]|jgi:hypothetical protein